MMKRKIFISMFLLFGLPSTNSSAEKSGSGRSAKDIELRSLLTLSNTDGEVSHSGGVFDRGVATKNGVKYRKFESSYGSVIILDTAKLSRHDIERAQCVPGMAPGASQTSDSTLVQAETAAAGDGGWKGYAALIQQTIKSKCDGSVPMATDVNPHLDLGFSRSIKDKSGNDTEIKVFNRDLGPNLNLGGHF